MSNENVSSVFCPIIKDRCVALPSVCGGCGRKCAFGRAFERDGRYDLQCDLADFAHAVASDTRDYGAPILDVVVRNLKS